jgi:CheY-like chemotaxis protein
VTKHGSSPIMKKRILVVEDDKDLLTILLAILNNAGYEATGVTNGIPIIEGLKEWPDLFILDKEMDYMDGIAICKFLRIHDAAKEIPIMMLSGSDSRKKAHAAGINFYMDKPFNKEEFLRIVDGQIHAAAS